MCILCIQNRLGKHSQGGQRNCFKDIFNSSTWRYAAKAWISKRWLWQISLDGIQWGTGKSGMQNWNVARKEVLRKQHALGFSQHQVTKTRHWFSYIVRSSVPHRLLYHSNKWYLASQLQEQEQKNFKNKRILIHYGWNQGKYLWSKILFFQSNSSSSPTSTFYLLTVLFII